jgi:hypothetical protein
MRDSGCVMLRCRPSASRCSSITPLGAGVGLAWVRHVLGSQPGWPRPSHLGCYGARPDARDDTRHTTSSSEKRGRGAGRPGACRPIANDDVHVALGEPGAVVGARPVSGWISMTAMGRQVLQAAPRAAEGTALSRIVTGGDPKRGAGRWPGSKPRTSAKTSPLRAAQDRLHSARSSASPASVGTMPAPERTSSAIAGEAPAGFFSDALTAGWCMPRRMAARETLRSVNTVCKTLIKMKVDLVEDCRVSHTGMRALQLICGSVYEAAADTCFTLAHEPLFLLNKDRWHEAPGPSDSCAAARPSRCVDVPPDPHACLTCCARTSAAPGPRRAVAKATAAPAPWCSARR